MLDRSVLRARDRLRDSADLPLPAALIAERDISDGRGVERKIQDNETRDLDDRTGFDGRA